MNAMSNTARFLTTICDTLQVINSCEKLLQAENETEETLAKASLINRLICLGFTITEIGLVISGTKSEKIAFLKSLELLPKLTQMGISILVEGYQMDGSLKSRICFVSKGILSPFADLTRVASENICYDEHHYLQMNPEELKNAKRPIYEYVDYGEDIHLEIVGYRPVDIEECKKNLDHAQKIGTASASLRMIAELDLPEKIVCNIGIPVYERLWNFLNGHPAPHHTTPVSGLDLIEKIQDFDLLNCTKIPLPLHDDAVFSQIICPISLEPIRDPVRDPTQGTPNGGQLYERSAITNWLKLKQLSPMTKKPLSVDQLKPAPAVKVVIDNRLMHHKQGLIDYLNAHIGDPVPAADQTIINQF